MLQNTSFAYGARASGRRFTVPGGTGFRDTRNENDRLAYWELDATYRLTNSSNIYLMCLNPKKPCVPRETTFRLTNSCHIYSLCFSPINLMCRERLAFGSMHPRNFRSRATEYQFPFRGSCLRTQVSLSWRDELQRHGPRGIAGDCVAERKFRRGDLCTGARLPSNETGSTKDPLMYEECKYRLAYSERGETSRLTNSSNMLKSNKPYVP